MTSIREFEHAGWQAAAATFDGFAGATALFVDPLLQAAGVKSGMRLLDVACGTGVASARAAALGARVTGVDFSSEMIAEARRRHPAIAFESGDAEALPFPDASFDAVVANFGIHHVERPGARDRRGAARARAPAACSPSRSGPRVGETAVAADHRGGRRAWPHGRADAGRQRRARDAGEFRAARRSRQASRRRRSAPSRSKKSGGFRATLTSCRFSKPARCAWRRCCAGRARRCPRSAAMSRRRCKRIGAARRSNCRRAPGSSRRVTREAIALYA